MDIKDFTAEERLILIEWNRLSLKKEEGDDSLDSRIQDIEIENRDIIKRSLEDAPDFVKEHYSRFFE
jgi:hypothetical protein